jgi:heme/copper-type cytochrome/quinol oxidase subunit 2
VLYSTTREDKYYITVKVIGHQWYWSYDYTRFKDLVYESFTLPREFIEVGSFRLIDVDNRCVVPININIIFILTSIDVIHSFSLPSLCLKTDCNPAYLNSLKQRFLLPALYYGFCREICGSGHRQISICVERTRIILFKD